MVLVPDCPACVASQTRSCRAAVPCTPAAVADRCCGFEITGGGAGDNENLDFVPPLAHSAVSLRVNGRPEAG